MAGDTPTTGGPDDGKDPGHAKPGGPIIGPPPSPDGQNPTPDPKHKKK